MVRTKVDIKRIEDKAKRHTTFTKRRQGLFKKASELCKRCNAEAAIITFSLAGNAFAYGHPSVEAVLNRYKANTQPPCTRGVDDGESEKTVPEVNAAFEDENDDEEEEEEEDDLRLGEMSMEALDDLELAMWEMKRKVINRVNEIITS